MEHRSQRRTQAAIPVQVRGVDAQGESFEEWIDALEAGAFDFVCKTFSRTELPWILENTLRSHVQRQGARSVGSGTSR